MDPTAPTCQDVVELVTEYLEDALSPADRQRFETHIEACPPCETYLEQMRRTIELLGRIPEETVSPDAERVLIEAFRGWTRSQATTS
jgi:anti-sigma factor RsiW